MPEFTDDDLIEDVEVDGEQKQINDDYSDRYRDITFS